MKITVVSSHISSHITHINMTGLEGGLKEIPCHGKRNLHFGTRRITQRYSYKLMLPSLYDYQYVYCISMHMRKRENDFTNRCYCCLGNAATETNKVV